MCYFGVQRSGNSIAVWKNGIEYVNKKFYNKKAEHGKSMNK